MKMKSAFLNEYKDRMLEVIQTQFPDASKKELERIIVKQIEKKVQDPHVTLDNNYTHESRETTALSVIDWSMDRKPILCGNGTFYKNQHEALNPIAKMLEGFLSERKRFKKLMFAIDDPNSIKYKDYDREQLNQKKSVNSYYGASGAPSSAFYSKWSGPRLMVVGPYVVIHS